MVLPLGQRAEVVDLSETGNVPARSVQELLDAALRAEELTASEGYDCDVCRREAASQSPSVERFVGTRASRQMCVIRAPSRLVLTLGRFAFDPSTESVRKIRDPVTITSRLLVPLHVGSEKQEAIEYALYGVILHHGPAATHGHYTAMVRDKSATWRLFDDATVSGSIMEAPEAVAAGTASTPYMLWFERVGRSEGAPMLRVDAELLEGLLVRSK